MLLFERNEGEEYGDDISDVWMKFILNIICIDSWLLPKWISKAYQRLQKARSVDNKDRYKSLKRRPGEKSMSP